MNVGLYKIHIIVQGHIEKGTCNNCRAHFENVRIEEYLWVHVRYDFISEIQEFSRPCDCVFVT